MVIYLDVAKLLVSGEWERSTVLVFDTKSLDHINFNALIAQSCEERNLEQMGL